MSNKMTKAAQQYNFKTKIDILNQLPLLFDKSLKNASVEEVLTKYPIFHHYGLQLNKKGLPIKKTIRKTFPLKLDITNLKFDQSQVAKDIYNLELNQHNYLLNTISSHIKLENLDILDIGSGSGATAFALTKTKTNHVYGINLANTQIKLTKKISKLLGVDDHITFIYENMNHLDKLQYKNKFDLIIQNETDQYVTDYKNFIKNIKLLLKPGGIYVTIGWYKTKDSQNVANVDRYYYTNMQNIKSVLNNIQTENFKIIQKKDLTIAALPYWYIRNLFEYAKGYIESEFIGGLENKSIIYKLLIIQKQANF